MRLSIGRFRLTIIFLDIWLPWPLWNYDMHSEILWTKTRKEKGTPTKSSIRFCFWKSRVFTSELFFSEIACMKILALYVNLSNEKLQDEIFNSCICTCNERARHVHELFHANSNSSRKQLKLFLPDLRIF